MNMVIMKKYFIREGPRLLLLSKNKLCAAKVFKNGFQCKILPQRTPSHGSTWQKVILIWQKQPSKLIQ